MLRFVEEIILLLLRDDDGKFLHVPSWSLDRAMAGGVLMDLAMENRIDADLENLILIDDTPVGDKLLDPVLADIAAGEQRDARYWVEHAAKQAETIREEALSRLVDAGILERQEDRFLWVFRSRRYPVIDGKAEREAADMEVLFSDEIPDPRDVVLIALADACDFPGDAVRARAGEGAHRSGAQARPHRQAMRSSDVTLAASRIARQGGGAELCLIALRTLLASPGHGLVVLNKEGQMA